MTIRLIPLLALLMGTVPAAYAQPIVNEATTYFVDLTFQDALGDPVLPETLQYSVYDKKTQTLLTAWSSLSPITANCPSGNSGCTVVTIPWDENLYVGRCSDKSSCLVDADCPTGQCKAKLEDEQDHVLSTTWTWGSGAYRAADRFVVRTRNLEFVPQFSPTPTSTNTPTATPTATPTPTS